MFRGIALGITVDGDNFLTEESNLIHSRFFSALVLPKINGGGGECWLGEGRRVVGFINENGS